MIMARSSCLQLRTSCRAWVLGAVALLLLAVAPGVAEAAGCVHNGLRRTWQVSGVARFEALWATGALAVPEGVEVPERSEPVVPKPVCSGPMCSSHQGLPTVPAVSTAVEPGLWAFWMERPGLAPSELDFLSVCDDSPRPTLVVDTIFHPPRIGLS
ncbi:MAG: hypothetical protein KatS3mg108_0221 [Isosphaeraceae bacterium]|nr:MAG: hypothetical protein KatS3mg108_0221 [Isosphaeraceae bacterium]